MANKRYDQFTAGGVTGDKLLLLADPTTGVLAKVTVDQLRGYKIYSAVITQSGTDAPAGVVLQNTLGEVPVWSYVSPGEYLLTAVSPVFLPASLCPQSGLAYFNSNLNNSWYFRAVRNDPNSFIVNTYGSTGATADDLISSTPNSFFFEIFIYPTP